jgi:hypothetical protein
LTQGGGTEMFVESNEPTLDELSLEEFFEIFPEGTYRFAGRTPEGGIDRRPSSRTTFRPGPKSFCPW